MEFVLNLRYLKNALKWNGLYLRMVNKCLQKLRRHDIYIKKKKPTVSYLSFLT